MKKLFDDDLKKIQGGTSLTSSLLNAFNSLFKSLMEFGEKVGSALRRIGSGEICPLK